MQGHVARKRDRFYAVIYEGLDPITGREKRSWHPAGTDRDEAEALARRLAAERDGRNDEVRALTFGAYLTGHWLPAKKLTLTTSSHRGYVHKTQRHILPALGRKRLRRLRPQHLERLYDSMLHPTDDRGALAPKTVYEVHLIIRGALTDAVRRGLVTRNVALLANAPKLRSIPKVEQQTWTASELQRFLRAAAGHRLFPAFWLSAMTGMRRNELLGLRWNDSTNSAPGPRSTVGSSQSVTNSTRPAARPKRPGVASTSMTRPSTSSPAGEHCRPPSTPPSGSMTRAGMFTRPDGRPIHPHTISQTFERIARRAAVPVIRLHDLRHTAATLLIAAGIPVKVVSERLGHANQTFTIETYQHVLPGMQADAARTMETLVTGVLPATPPARKAG